MKIYFLEDRVMAKTLHKNWFASTDLYIFTEANIQSGSSYYLLFWLHLLSFHLGTNTNFNFLKKYCYHGAYYSPVGFYKLLELH